MKLAIDVFYQETKAKIIGLLFDNWEDENYLQKVEKYRYDIAEYEPGAFYKRELPCIMDILQELDLSKLDCIIVDGYVFLDDNQKLGLGGHLYNMLEQRMPIIGVAKTSFANNTKNVREVLRGKSQKPLYVTAIGTNLEQAVTNVKNMAGEFRFPKLLKQLDDFTKI